nr:unnamed protein product [Spirometra erinaceieuropaei]
MLRWQDWTLDTDVLERTAILSIYAMLRQLQLRKSGHLVCMENERLPQINVNGAQIQVVDYFTYPGSALSRSTRINDEVARGFPKPVKSSVVCETLFRIDTVSTSAPN